MPDSTGTWLNSERMVGDSSIGGMDGQPIAAGSVKAIGFARFRIGSLPDDHLPRKQGAGCWVLELATRQTLTGSRSGEARAIS
jgi:hypothetical protein